MEPIRFLSIRAILAWADDHKWRTGDWPQRYSGPVAAAPGATWEIVHQALRVGHHGLPGGSSLARVLARFRGRPHPDDVPCLTEAKILAWADAHRARTGEWPWVHSGMVADAPGERWAAINKALYAGFRGLPGGNSLARLLVRHGRLPGLYQRRCKPLLAVARSGEVSRRRHPGVARHLSGSTAGRP